MSTHAFVFPGQGSQSIGMLETLSTHYPLVRNIFDNVSAHLGEDIWELVQSGPVDKLNQTEYTQVAMLAADVSVYEVLKQQGAPNAQVMAGHSLGEYAALVCADAISLENAASLVYIRGKLMQKTVPMGVGAMAAIVGLTNEQVQELCELSSTDELKVTPANFNAIGQVVIAGHTEAVNKAIEKAESMDARLAKIIPVSVPCHCPLLMDAALQFESALADVEWKVPTIPVISNVDLSVYQSVAQIRDLLKAQLYSPVRWVETILKIQQLGVNLVFECGPGAVLSGLIKRIDKSMTALSVYDDVRLKQALISLGV